MTIEVKVPILAESVAEANLLSWQKKIGDTVKRGDNLIDIETDKVTLEVAAPDNGILIEILKQGGEEVQSDEIIAKIDTEKKQTEPDQAGLNQTKTDSSEKPIPQQKILLEDKQPINVQTNNNEAKLSPAVRNLLSKNKLQATDIKARKNPDRITKEDILNHLGITPSANTTENAIPGSTSIEELTHTEQKERKLQNNSQENRQANVANLNNEQRPQELVPMTRLRKRVAERLLSAQHENALLTTFNEVNMQPIMDLRRRYKEEFAKTHEVKLGFMSFFTRAAVEALKKFPVINASVDGENILYRGYFDIGIAVSSPRGLVVPVLRDADTLSFAAIESGVSGFGQKAKEGTLSIEELTGGTFTITNGGVFGSLLSTPIINPPQSAILGMHKIQERPVAENGEVVIRPMMYLALSYDHRIIDGREAVQFLVSIKEQIEDPSRLLLQI